MTDCLLVDLLLSLWPSHAADLLKALMGPVLCRKCVCCFLCIVIWVAFGLTVPSLNVITNIIPASVVWIIISVGFAIAAIIMIKNACDR